MDRAFGELEDSFYESGGVLSQKTCVDVLQPTRAPVRRPVIERSDRHVAIGGRFTETVSLGVPECVELGGYYRIVSDHPDDLADYDTYELDAAV